MLVAPQHACTDPSNLHLVGMCDYSYVVTIIGDVPYFRVMVTATDTLLSGGITVALPGGCIDSGAVTGAAGTQTTLAWSRRRSTQRAAK